MQRSEIKTEQDRLDYATHRTLKHTYGIGIEQYNQMFAAQNGCCAICGKHQKNFKRRLHIDHNHQTGEIRALLCPKCNVILGNSGESVGLLAKIAEYIEKWNI